MPPPRSRGDPMRVLIDSEQEAALIERRLRAVHHCLGPLVEIEVRLPDGRRLLSPRGGLSPAARCASLNERMEERLSGCEV
jgi:hypothetical protein